MILSVWFVRVWNVFSIKKFWLWDVVNKTGVIESNRKPLLLILLFLYITLIWLLSFSMAESFYIAQTNMLLWTTMIFWSTYVDFCIFLLQSWMLWMLGLISQRNVQYGETWNKLEKVFRLKMRIKLTNH